MSQHTGRAMRQVWSVAGRLFSTFAALVVVSSVFPSAVRAQSLPSGWTATNIGAPAIAGRASYSGSTFTVEGGGTCIFSTADQFFYVHRQMSGDFTAVTRVASLENTNVWAKAGVMIRETLGASSRHAFLMVTPAKGIVFHRRATTGGTTDAPARGASGAAPVWLRLQREGSRITASRSTNGTSWTTMGYTTVSMASNVYVGLAVASYNANNAATAAFGNVDITTPAGPLPSGWGGTDVGSPVVDGGASYSNGTFTVQGGGTDISGTSDQFAYVYRQISGDVDVVARVSSLSGPDAGSKGGVMVRSSLTATSAHASLFVTRSNGLAFQRRPASGLSTLSTSAGTGVAPVWVKLERRGSAVTAFRSGDGASWTMIGSETLTLPSTFYVGLAVTSRSTSSAALAGFSNVSVASPSTTSTPPTVSLTAPASGATYTAPATVAITASASDSDGVAMVEFYANGTLLGTDSTSPYAYSWSVASAGTYSLTAVARDARGATATSAARSITVGGASNTPPTVSLSAPTNGASYLAPASVTISANAADSGGSIVRVDFYAGSTLVGSDATSPYSVTWTNVAAGSYSLIAVARDNGGASTTSSPRTITVTAIQAPTTALFEPSPDHSSVTYRLDIFAAGANPSTATPRATLNMGRPSVLNGECRVGIATTISALPAGSYFATVVAVGSNGTSTRATSGTFSR